MEDITNTIFLKPKYTIMLPTGECLLGAASKYYMARYYQEITIISATYSYSQYNLNEVLHMEKVVK